MRPTLVRGSLLFGGQLLRLGWLQARSCAFAVALFAGMASVRLLPAGPIPPYDLLLVYGVSLTALSWLVGWESRRDVAAIAVCHLLGLVLELVKVGVGSWSYPEAALTKVAGVPLYSGFMYAAVGSYVCSAWRILEVQVSRYRPGVVTAVSAGAYLDFLTDHWLPDLRWVLALTLFWVSAGSMVHFTVGRIRHRMPLALAFALIGFLLWLAENIATCLGAWRYPYQLPVWHPVMLGVWSSWALLVPVMFVLIHRLATDRAARLRPTVVLAP
ncbi:DUF817 domain-containing protein [Kitasatospora paranensis]|uniref:DUF817 domain-containing protein n=1 Tax=Kitasatospora paranensis TaxID=258053 RepID=A0ABW2G2J8_9ACTN